MSARIQSYLFLPGGIGCTEIANANSGEHVVVEVANASPGLAAEILLSLDPCAADNTTLPLGDTFSLFPRQVESFILSPGQRLYATLVIGVLPFGFLSVNAYPFKPDELGYVV